MDVNINILLLGARGLNGLKGGEKACEGRSCVRAGRPYSFLLPTYLNDMYV